MTELQKAKQRAFLVKTIRQYLPAHLQALFDELMELG
jgi:hypothetical protein